jgi:hypothetical protein
MTWMPLVGRAESHDPLDARPVVPGAIEQDDFAGSRQLRDVALEVPLSALDFARLLEGDDAGAAGVQMLHEALDRAALTCGIAPLEQDDDPGARVLDPRLQFQQLDLQAVLVTLVGLARHQVAVGVGTFAPALGELRILGRAAQLARLVAAAQQQLAQRVHVVRRGSVENRLERLAGRGRVLLQRPFHDVANGKRL